MPLLKTLPFRKPLGIAGSVSSVSEIKALKPFAATVNLSLPTRIATIGNYLPRQCGIATFTTDLCDAMAAEYGSERLFAMPVNDPESEYSYPERVRFELVEQELASYQRATEFLNFTNVDLVCVQHEYGIFGGTAGNHVLELLRKLRMPIVTTLHTVLREPNPEQHRVMVELAELSDRLIVMSQHSSKFLQEIFHIPAEKIDVIPHGVPNLAFVDPNFFKDRFCVGGKSVLVDFRLAVAEQGSGDSHRGTPGDSGPEHPTWFISSPGRPILTSAGAKGIGTGNPCSRSRETSGLKRMSYFTIGLSVPRR